MGAVDTFLVKASRSFIPRRGEMASPRQDPKEQFVSLMRIIYECIEREIQSGSGPNGETLFDWSWPITIKVGIEHDVKNIQFVAEVSAEGKWK